MTNFFAVPDIPTYDSLEQEDHSYYSSSQIDPVEPTLTKSHHHPHRSESGRKLELGLRNTKTNSKILSSIDAVDFGAGILAITLSYFLILIVSFKSFYLLTNAEINKLVLLCLSWTMSIVKNPN